tara:strand:+ start:99 stop:320 length:222 start_codon:yes stop_codon:yes gene_type:complete
MSKDDNKYLGKNTPAIRRVVNCLNAEKRALHGEFKAYWKDTAAKIANESDIDIKKVKSNLELYNARAESSSIH